MCRYDFFEAKRRDLLAAARRAREQIMADGEQPLAVVAQESGLSKGLRDGPSKRWAEPCRPCCAGAILALNSDTLKLERQKLLRAQETERTLGSTA